MAARLEIHVEWWYHALHSAIYWFGYEDDRNVRTMYHLLDILKYHNVVGDFYILGVIARAHPDLLQEIRRHGHRIGSHGWAHGWQEHEEDDFDLQTRRYIGEPLCGYRPPYWQGTRPGYGGGAFFRWLPYPLVKWEVQRSGVLYLHPHDLDLHLSSLRRSVCIGEPWQKLTRLLTEVDFERR